MTKAILCNLCKMPRREEINPSTLGFNPSNSSWRCRNCIQESQILCSHCDVQLKCDPLPEPLDDGSFLCNTCNTKLLEELDEFTSNH